MRCPIIAIEHDPIQTYYCRYTSHFIVSDTTCVDGDKNVIPRTEARDDAGAVDWVEFSNGAALRGNRRRRPNFQERLCDPAEHLSAIAVDEADANARSVPTFYLKAYFSV